jgi:hypothetical protein
MSFIGNNIKIKTSTVVPQATRPANPVEGMLYFDDGTTFTEGVYKYQNSAWEYIGSLVDHLKLNALAADPTTPVQGQLFYSDGTARAEGLWSFNGTDWQPVGSEGGSLDIIYQENFETDMKAANLTSGNNASFDGGGTLDGALSDETTNPLNGRNSIKYVAGSSSANDYFHTGSKPVPVKSRGVSSFLSLHASFSGTAGDIKAIFFDDTNNTILGEIDLDSTTSKPYLISATIPLTCTAIKVGFQAQSGITNLDELIFDDFEIVTAAFKNTVFRNLTDFAPYTPSTTQGFGTITNNQLLFREEGDTIRIIGSFTTGTTSAVEARLALPTGYTINSALTNITSAGEAIRNIASSNARAQSILIQAGFSYLRFAFAASGALTPQNGNAMFASGEKLAFEAIIPVNEISVSSLNTNIVKIKDGVTAPATILGSAQIYVDSADGDLKVIFGDGTVKTIVTDS